MIEILRRGFDGKPLGGRTVDGREVKMRKGSHRSHTQLYDKSGEAKPK